MLEEYRKRREKLAEKMNPNSMLVAFAGKPKHRSLDLDYEFEVERNFYYLTGLDVADCILLMLKEADEAVPYLFVPRLSKYDEVMLGETRPESWYQEKTGIQAVLYLEDFETQINLQTLHFGFQTLYFCADKLVLMDQPTVEGVFAEKVRMSLPGMEISSLGAEIKKMRAVKSETEISLIRRAIEITHRGIDEMLCGLKPGAYEYEMEADFVHGIRRAGARGESFPTIMASGANSCALHYTDNHAQLKDGEMLLIDVGADYQYYCADVSRTYPVNGKFTEEQAYWYNVLLRAQELVIQNMGPGKRINDSGIEARAFVAEKMVEAGILEKPEMIANIYLRNFATVGRANHQIGLDAHDNCGEPSSPDDIFRPGMVYAVEPGIYLRDQKLGIRIEDDVLITEDGVEVLTAAIPKTVEEIEAILAGRQG